jgi:hypothetical protein
MDCTRGRLLGVQRQLAFRRINSEWQLAGGEVRLAAVLLLFSYRLWHHCGAHVGLAPHAYPDVGRLRSVHLVLVNKTPAAAQWFFDELQVILTPQPPSPSLTLAL